jgi:hypothetical protein
MRCRCGNEIKNVPEHLRGLASWVCEQCTNTAPKQNPVVVAQPESFRKPLNIGRRKQAA